MSRSKPMENSKEYQKEILNLMLKDSEFCYKASKSLQSTDFTQELAWVFSAISAYGGKPPTRGTLECDLTKHDEKHHLMYRQTIDDIFKANGDADHIRNEMTDFIKKNLFVDNLMETAALYNAHKTKEAFQKIEFLHKRLLDTNFGNEDLHTIGEWTKLVKDAEADSRNSVPTGIHAIDRALGGGLSPGSWTTFLGPSNSGKSMVMATLAKQAAENGQNVFVTVHEDEIQPTKLRYLACFAGVNLKSLMMKQLTSEDVRRLDEAATLLNKHVRFKFLYGFEASITNVEREVENLHSRWAFNLYICDYGQCLSLPKSKGMETRLLQQEIYQRLSQLCLKLKIAGVGGAQVNRTGNFKNRSGTDWLTKEDVGESFGIVMKSSNVITMNRSSSDMINNRIVFLLDKNRNGPTPVAVECVSDYSKCQVYFTSNDNQVDVTKMIDLNSSKPSKAKV